MSGNLIVNIIIISVLFLLIGFLCARYRDRFLFVKAGFAFIAMLLSSTVAVFMAGFLAHAGIVKLLHYNMDIFVFGIVTLLIGGSLNFLFILKVKLFTQRSQTMLMLTEYYIQWVTLFFTLYQFFTGSHRTMMAIKEIDLSSKVINVDILNIAVLPVLLVAWISIAMMKVYITEHNDRIHN
ncbi:hypothetical protein D3P96_02030 [Weissella viridescens]|uniref:Uncharacterized protein n=1 Tax=Weissella viridescens TaxID=1629 RepID=A0A3P2RGT6_WEIVI|nr:hypothetical protein [Weissella viridescens]RRG18785.1 hypothetical protein D3P96_02030 [Weissella viridescens]